MQTSKDFVENLAKLSEEMLLQFDNMLVVDDVLLGSEWWTWSPLKRH